MAKGRVLSGMRPTGRLHLGHLEGVIRNWVRLQREYDCFFFAADWHAVTDSLETGDIQENIREMVIDWLAAGVDPKLATIFVQSSILEHAELHLLLSMVTPVGWLERCATFKDKLRDLGEGEQSVSYGLLGYPVLMSSDIIIYKAEHVPVGADQVPHLEIAREIVRRFNSAFRPVFVEPQPLLTEAAKLPGIDGRKMSKSYGNTILIGDSEKDTADKVGMMVTDPARVRKTDPGHPEVCTVFQYHKIYSPDRVDEIRAACEDGRMGCVECKKILAAGINEALAPIRARRRELSLRWDEVREIILAGCGNARRVASATLEEAASAMNLRFKG